MDVRRAVRAAYMVRTRPVQAPYKPRTPPYGPGNGRRPLARGEGPPERLTGRQTIALPGSSTFAPSSTSFSMKFS